MKIHGGVAARVKERFQVGNLGFTKGQHLSTYRSRNRPIRIQFVSQTATSFLRGLILLAVMILL